MSTMKKLMAATLSLTLILSLASCGDNAKQKDAPDLQQYYDDFMATMGDDAPAMGDTNEDASYVDTFLPGLNDIELKQSVLRMAMISLTGFELDLVECANEEDVETVQSIFQTRIDNQVNGEAFYPETIECWENADLLVNGNIVALIVAGEYQEDAVNAFNALFD